MKTRNLCTVFLLCTGVWGFAQSITQNYTTETIYKEGRNPSGSYTPNAGDFVTVTYYDGLGRPIQQLQKNASPVDNKNIVTHTEYDKNIGQTRQYLPFTTTGSNADYVSAAKQATLDYYTTYNEYTENPYSETRYEAAPNGRVTEEGAPGYDWSISVYEGYGIPRDERNTIRYDYSLNTATEVKKFDVTSSWNASRELYTNTIAQNGNYPANSLKKIITKNENWKSADGKNNTTEEFTGADGKAVLKRTYNAGVAHDTYYVYDFYGNLAYVIPPLANGSVTTTNLNNLCYQYLYDDKNRLVEKKLPQKGWEFIVYDKADRIVMTGPVNNPFSTSATPGWIVTKYDNMGRTLYTGYYSGHTVTSANRKAIKTSIYAQADNNETKTTANTTINGVTTRYTNSKFPTAINLLTVNYYDNYDFPNAPTSFPAVQGVTPVQAAKGLATGSWTRVITTPLEQKADVSYTLYNSKYQPLRTYTTNYLGGYIQTDNVLTFRGIPTKTITTHKKDAAATVLTITNNYTHDNRERLKTHTQQINGGTAKLIAENTYDELGVLITKKVGNTTAVPLQKVDYKYNVRGWLTNINNAEQGYVDTENDLFNYMINYNQSGGNINNKVLYNGNINSVFSRTKTDNVLRGYSYYYDDLNRLAQAKNLYYESGGWNIGVNEDDSYGEALSYDKNGNILTVSRSGELVSGQPVEIDDLTYTYTANQLQTVTDATNNPAGFNDGNTTGTDYTYDTFGNLKTDKNKGITNIVYNHLNLPVEITFATGKINYTYDAAGTKVKKVVTPTGGTAQTTDYLFGFEYESGVLSTFPHAEGYVKNNAGQYIYHYIYRDHLGNNRLVYADLDGNGTINPATEIVEESNYYPFGLKHEGYNELPGDGYKYKFLNKEYEDSFALNVTETDYRQYDAALGRFYSMDALSESSFSYTPYHYSYNNPVYWNDPTGLLSDSFIASIWNNSPDGMNTHWVNMGDSFVGSYINDIGYALAVFYDGSVEESLPMMYMEATRGGGGHLNFTSYGTYGLGEMVRDHTYRNSAYYQHYRDAMWSKQWDGFQKGLDYIGMIPIIGEPIDLINGGISAIRGDYVAAGLSLGAMIPVGGYLANAIKIQKHHIIPKAVYRDAGEAVQSAMKLNGGNNLKKLPSKFHGNHPQYSTYVEGRLNNMRINNNISPGSIQALQKDLNGMINNAYDNYKATGGTQNLNDYFRQFNGN